MEISRFTEAIELNNAWLIGLGVAAVLLATWMVLVTTSFVLRHGIRASRIHALEPFAEGIYRRARLLASILSVLVLFSGAGLLGYTIWQGIDLQPAVDMVLTRLTPENMTILGRSAGLVIVLLAGFYVLQRVGRRLAARAERALQQRIARDEQRAYVEQFLAYLPSVINLALLYGALSLTAAAVQLPDWFEWLVTTVIYILLVVSGGRTLVFLIYFLGDRLLWSWEGKSKGTKLEDYYAVLRRLWPVGQKSVAAIIYVSVVTLVVRRFETLEPFAPYGPVLIRIISLFFAASVLGELSRVLLARLLLGSGDHADDSYRRRHTFVSLLQAIVKYLIYFCIGMMVLSDLGIDPTPILAGAGIVGLTVGLGSQKIVEDLVSGLFLLFEDQILIGDYIRIGETEGQVEEITLRVTRIRDRFGRLHTLRNGQIQNVINYSRGWTMAVVEMSVSYESKLDEALAVCAEASAKLPELFPGVVMEVPRVVGIEAMDDSCLRVRIEAKVAPGRHYEVKRVMNRLLVDHFNARGLEIPYPKSVQFSPDSPEEPGPGPAQ
jgi:small-conductance mechanosensitive channel